MRPLRFSVLFVLLSLLTACGGGGGGTTAGNTPVDRSPGIPSPPAPPVIGEGRILVLSNRADLISGGDALVRVVAKDPKQLDGATMTVGDRDVTDMLTPVNGTLEGLVSGLALGDNTLTVHLADHSILRRHIINHPYGGPVFAGPQVQPWNCTNDKPLDAQCNQAPTFSFKYVPADKLQSVITNFDPAHPQLPPAFLPYDPNNPPPANQIAKVTTDQGVTVPFIVRVEIGVVDRDRYQIMTLFQPGKPWTALHPQKQWNHKLLIHHGGNVGVAYGMGEPPNGDISGTAPKGTEFLLGDSITVALGRGFMTLSTAASNLGHNVNLVTAAESLMMAKEHLIEQYGTLRYTIGTGCSGGSIAQQHIANAYPGIYQGLIVQCSYPDVWTTATEFADYHLLSHYFGNEVPSSPDDFVSIVNALLSSGVLPVAQWVPFYGHLPLNPVVADNAFFPSVFPDQADCPGLDGAAPVYDAATRPDGLRCGLIDYMINQFGPRPRSVWSPNEQLVGHGFAGIPVDNVGVQYGLKALQAGLITGQQFLAVNRGIGGLNVDIDYQPQRTEADPQALRNAYKDGAINSATHMANVPIIDLRGPDPGLAHDAYHSWQMRARLQKAQGYFGNQVIWFSAVPLAGDTTYTTQALLVMDRWLSDIENDHSDKSIAKKVVDDKPIQARDRCLSVSSLLGANGPIVPFTGNILYPDPIIPGLDLSLLPPPPPQAGVVVDAVTDQVCGLDLSALGLPGQVGQLLSPITDRLVKLQNTVVETRFGTPRTIAGDAITTLTNKCQLKPVDPADYPVNPLTGILDAKAFAAKVAAIFPNGVCDYSKPPADDVPTQTWLQYGTADQVIYGGAPITDDASGDSRQGWAAPAFDVGIGQP